VLVGATFGKTMIAQNICICRARRHSVLFRSAASLLEDLTGRLRKAAAASCARTPTWAAVH